MGYSVVALGPSVPSYLRTLVLRTSYPRTLVPSFSLVLSSYCAGSMRRMPPGFASVTR